MNPDDLDKIIDRANRRVPRTSKSYLATMIERQTTSSLVGLMHRSVDVFAESLAQELLRDLAFREQMRQLLHAAFARAIAELQQPSDGDA